MESPSENAKSGDSISDSKLDIDFAEVESLLAVILHNDWHRFCLDRKVELQNKFASLTDGERDQILTLLREDALRVRSALYSLRPLILRPFDAVVDIFFDIIRTAPYRYQPFNIDDSASLIETISLLHMHGVCCNFDDLCLWLCNVLPQRFIALSSEELSEFKDKFNSLSYEKCDKILTSVGGCSSESIGYFYGILDAGAGPTAVDTILHALLKTADCYQPFNVDDFATWFKATSPLHRRPVRSNFVNLCHLLWKVHPQRFIALSTEELSELEYKFNSLLREKCDKILTSVDRCSPESIGYVYGILDTAVDIISHAPLETAAVPALTNFESGNFWVGPSDGPSYASSIQIDLQKLTASMNMWPRETIFREESLAPISSPRIYLCGGNMVTSHHNLKAGSGHHSQRAPPDQQNSHLPDAASTGYTSQDHDSLCIDMSNIDNTGTRSHSGMAASPGNPPTHQGEFIDTSNGLASYAASSQSHSQRSADGIDLTSVNVELPSGNGRIPSEARDEETAGYLKFFKTVAPPILLAAYSALTILKSTNKAQPASTKALTCITLGSTCVAVCTSLAGASLSFFKPNTLPFGCNPRRILQIMQNVTLHSTVYAFIGTLCLRFLQDHQLEMWMAFGLPSAIFMAVMIFIGWRR